MLSSIEKAVMLVLALQKKKRLNSYVLTGAGVSRGSNIPTFRGNDGLWERYNFEEVATLRAWETNPEKLWTFYIEGIQLILNSSPNPAHVAISLLEELGFCQTIITQNADGLHQKAGSKNVLEVHGNLLRVHCVSCNTKQIYSEPPKEIPPKCSCGRILRPDVVFFDEQLPSKVINKAFKVAQSANLAIIVGTSAEVIPAAYLPMFSKRNKALVLVFNTEETEHSQLADVFIKGKCEETLSLFVEKLIQTNHKKVN